MLAVVKTPRIDVRIKGTIPGELLKVLEQVYADKLEWKDDDNELLEVKETAGYKAYKKKMKPGDYVRM